MARKTKNRQRSNKLIGFAAIFRQVQVESKYSLMESK